LVLANGVVVDRLLRSGLGLDINDRLPGVVHRRRAPLGEQFVHVIGDPVEFLRPGHQIHGPPLGQRRAPALGHAAEETEHHTPLPVVMGHEAHLAERLLLGHVAHAARVEQDDVGLGLVGRHFIAARGEHLRDLFGIALVHLATVGFDEDFGHGKRGEKMTHSRPKCKTRWIDRFAGGRLKMV
jgi:hypothetical protein